MSEILIGDLFIKILDPISDELVMAFGTKGAEWQTILANSYYFKRRFSAGNYTIDLKSLLIAPDLLAVRVSDPITLTYIHSNQPYVENTANLRANGVWIYTCRGYIDETTPGEYIDTVKFFITEVDNTEIEFLAGSRGVDGENIVRVLGGGGGGGIDPNPNPIGGR